MLLNLDKFTEGFEHIYGEEETPARQSLNEEYSLYINDKKVDVFDCLADLPDDFWDDEDEVEVWNEENGKQAGYKAPYSEYEDYEPVRRPADSIQDEIEEEPIEEACDPIQECEDIPSEKQPKPNRLGTPEYAANEGRRKREAMYRKYANIDEDFEITEENIKPWAFRRTCTMNNCQEDRLKAELLRKPFTGYERYDED